MSIAFCVLLIYQDCVCMCVITFVQVCVIKGFLHDLLPHVCDIGAGCTLTLSTSVSVEPQSRSIRTSSA